MGLAAKLKGVITQSRSAAVELTDGLESVRARIATLNAERSDVEGAEVSLAEADARVDQFMVQMRGPLADTYVGYEPCQTYGQALQAGGATVQVTVFPNEMHGFDGGARIPFPGARTTRSACSSSRPTVPGSNAPAAS